MAQLIIVDPASTSRASMAHQLSQFNVGTCLQFKSLEMAYMAIKDLPPTAGVIIASLYTDIPTFLSFVSKVRQCHPELGIIATTDPLSFPQMRSLISAGIDQVMVRPFNTTQFKDKIISAIRFRQQVLTEKDSTPKTEKVPFEATIEQLAQNAYKATLKGWIEEHCSLPEVKPADKKSTLFVDLEFTKGVNSIGVRSWVIWLKTLQAYGFQSFEFENLHPTVLQQASMVHDFIPKNGRVNSFYLYYWSEELKTDKEYKFVRGVDFSDTELKIPEERKDVINGKTVTLEVSHSLEKILKFYPGKLTVT